MANESGTSSAPHKADGKSVGVSGTQAVQMLLKREASATVTVPSAEPTLAAPVKTEEATPKPAPSDAAPAAPSEKVAKPEAPAETPEPEQTPPDEVLSSLSPEQRERFDKRIDKEVRKRKELQEEITRLRALANVVPPAPVTQTAPPPVEVRMDGPLSGIWDAAEVQRRASEAEGVKDWAQAQLDAEVSEAKLAGQSYDKQALRAAVRNADRFVTRDVPKQLDFIKQKAQADRQTAETFGSESWMQDRSSEGYQAYQQIMRDPDIAKRPAASWMAAVQVQGLLDVQRRLRAAGKPAEALAPPKPKAPASQTVTGAATGPTREPGESKAVKALEAEMENLKKKKGVTGRDVESYFRKMETARTR